MFKPFALALAVVTICGFAVRADDTITVEIYCATEHVPAGLKAGNHVDLFKVSGKTVTPAGKVSYTTNGMAQNIEVVSVTAVENPKTPEEAVKVELQVTKGLAAAIDKVKKQLVSVTEATSDGQSKTQAKPIPFRLELTKAQK